MFLDFFWTNIGSRLVLVLLEVDDASEFLGVEGGTTDQASVDLGHGHELVDAIGCHGSTVLDAGGLGDVLVVHLGQDGSQEGVRVVCGGDGKYTVAEQEEEISTTKMKR